MATTKKINLPFLAKLFGGLFAFVLAVYFLHEIQVKRNSAALLRRATTAREAGDLDESARLRMRYLSHNPHEAEQYLQTAFDLKTSLIDKLQKRQEFGREDVGLAMRYMEEAIQRNGAAPENEEEREVKAKLRREAADLYFTGRNYLSTVDNLEALGDLVGRDNWTEKDRMMYINSLRLMGGPNEEKAIVELEKTLGFDEDTGEFDVEKAKHPEILEAYRSLAVLLFQSNFDRIGAMKVLDQMCEVNKDNAQAYLIRSQLVRGIFKGKRTDLAHQDVQKAYELDPTDIGVLTQTSLMFREQKQPQKAREVVEQALQSADSENLSRRGSLYIMLFEIIMTQQDENGNVNQQEAMALLDRANREVPFERELLWSKARLLLDAKEHEQVEEMYPTLAKAGVESTVIDYLRARIKMHNGETDVAVKALERIRPALPPKVRFEADIFLIDGYGKLKKYDQQLASIRELRKINPSDERVNKSYLTTLLLRNRDTEAREFVNSQIKALLEAGEPIPEHYALADTRLKMKQIDPNSSDGELKSIQKRIVQFVNNPNVTPLQRQSLLIDYFTRLNNPAKAKQAIRKAITESPDVFMLWPMLLDLTESEAEANSVLKEMGAKFGGKPAYDPTIRTMTAKITAKHNPEAAAALLQSLEQNLDGYSDQQKSSLYYELAKVHLLIKNNAEADRLLQQALELKSQNQLAILTLIFDQAIAAGDQERIEQMAKTFRDAYGPNDESTRMTEARRIIWSITNGKSPNPKDELAKARELVEPVRLQRPDWFPALLVASDVERLDGNINGALELLMEAYNVQPNNGRVIRLIAEIHRRSGQSQEARKWMTRLPYAQRNSKDDEIELSTLLKRKENWTAEEISKALQLLESVMPETSDQAEGHVLRSDVFFWSKNVKAAEASAKRALELDRSNAKVWMSLVSVYGKSGQREKAENVIQQIDSELSEGEIPIVKARCYAILKDYPQAQQQLSKALANDPQNITIKRMLAESFVAGNNARGAAQVIGNIIDTADPEKDLATLVWARRALAQILGQSKTYAMFDKALELVEKNGKDGLLGPVDLGLYTMFCHGRPEKSSWQRGLDRIEKVAARRSLSDSEQFMKAQLMEKFGDLYWREVKQLTTNVAARRSGDNSIIDPYIKWLLKRGEISEAERWAENNLSRESVTRFRVNLFADAKRGQVKEAIQRIVRAAPKKEQLEGGDPKLMSDLLTMAVISEELGQFDKQFYALAEKLMRDLVSKRPKEVLRLAAIVGLHGGKAEVNRGLQICMNAKKQGIPDSLSAGVAVAILREHSDKWDSMASSLKAVDDWFKQVSAANAGTPDELMLQWRMADFYDMIGNLDQVEELYKKILSSPKFDNPNDRGMVMNNLAYAMALNGKTDEPLQLVGEAQKLLKDNADLLDTLGFVHYARGDLDKAISEYQRAIEGGPKSGHKMFHLALAFDKKKDQKSAQESWTEALSLGLDKFKLPPALRGEFDRLQRKLTGSPLAQN